MEKPPLSKPATRTRASSFLILAGASAALLATRPAQARDVTLLNASYDVTRELYKDINPAFAAAWKKRTGDVVTVNQSHGGSSKQARAVIDGLEADVVTMNQGLDIDAIAEKTTILPRDWRARLPNRAVPFTSTILFVVRKGNPKGIKDWDDLVRAGVVPIIPNPKTSGNGRYTYLAAWASALRRSGGDEAAAREFVAKLFKAVPVLDTGGRGATTTFAARGIGDVLLTFENEAALAVAEAPDKGLTAVVPSSSILAESPVAVVDRVAARKGNAAAARAYLEFLFSDEAQEIATRHHLRPVQAKALARSAASFPTLQLVSVDEMGGWSAVQAKHFADGALFDQIFQASAAKPQSPAAATAAAAAKPPELRLDFATYNPSSLVLKKLGWLEQELQADGVPVRWLFSAGSNKANELLSSNSTDFASTAGSAALLARANGVPHKIVYVYSRPEWAQLIVTEKSGIRSVADLRGKKLAATRGTDPFTLALRALHESGLGAKDVEIVNLQHGDGYLAWQRGNVDAWAALDPFLASALLKDHGRVLFRKVEFNSFGVLNAREDFAARYPLYVERVIRAYERARVWILAHPKETADILAEAAKIDLGVARNQLAERTGLRPEEGVGVPGPLLRKALEGVAPVLVQEKIVKPGVDPAKAIDELIEPVFAARVIGSGGAGGK